MNTIMKKITALLSFVLIMIAFASCERVAVKSEKTGYLSFDEFVLDLDENVETKSAQSQNTSLEDYTIIILDSDEFEVKRMTYSEVLESDTDIELLAGDYTLIARSTADEVPVAAFDAPVYGVSKTFKIDPGVTTPIGELVCTLVQCKVTISYSPEFIDALTGPGQAIVTQTAGHPLEYELSEDGVYEQRAGYFKVSGSTMTVQFSGKVNGKVQSMKQMFSGIEPKQWRQVRFVTKKNDQGNATFDIVIDDLIDDEPLNVFANASETILGDDPDAPKGDGGITLSLDYEAGCDPQITDLLDVRIVPMTERLMSIKFRAQVPSGVKKFTVDISTDNSAFEAAVAAAEATHLNLVSPSAANGIIFEVVPFPHGAELLGQTDIPFDLSAAQEAIINYKGRHTFMMTIVDMEGCKNDIPVVMVVE